MKLSDLLTKAEVEARRLSALGDDEAAETMRLLAQFARGVAEALAG
ncbi:hypothetical protein [Aureimonas sp. Leaf324]|nr:hypothetical protein [Aureimonas sp. Leaf324]